MKIITWNLGYWQYRNQHSKAWAYLRRTIKPDIALLQETNPPDLRRDEYLVFKSIRRNWGTAIYTKNMPLKKLRIKKHSNRIVAAQLELSNGKQILAVSIHVPIIKGRIFPHLDEIFHEIENVVIYQTFIVGGDLNTARLAEKVWPGHGHGPFFQSLKKSIFFDCHQKFHYKEQQTYFRNNSKHPFQNDHLFVSHDLAEQVKSCNVLNSNVTRSLSDHIPLSLEIEI